MIYIYIFHENEAETCLQWYRGAEYEIQTELDELVKKNKELSMVGQESKTLALISL